MVTNRFQQWTNQRIDWELSRVEGELKRKVARNVPVEKRLIDNLTNYKGLLLQEKENRKMLGIDNVKIEEKNGVKTVIPIFLTSEISVKNTIHLLSHLRGKQDNDAIDDCVDLLNRYLEDPEKFKQEIIEINQQIFNGELKRKIRI